ncbi:phage integrase family protein [Photobacterium leiognathi lrivu.4.1]|uniref:Phage integrase family protein n=1 Tax=Photobacterium leiognathi lrivu.4.1 TaxID=1248232 RepID=A0A0U1P538_PHOLE|nr:tyrosine-type recombinase/integrase [Photobacterium leiognathi]GAD29801.1 phage integrase family protein [Photobacterium leiognathi lrivu.4.1]
MVEPIINMTERKMFISMLKVQNQKAHAFALVSMSTALRASDVLSLKWSDMNINLETKTITVGVKEQKTGSKRIPAIKGQAFDALIKLHGQGEYVFMGNKGKPMGRHAMTAAYKKAASTIGLSYNVNTHSGRKTNIFSGWMHGMDLETARIKAGHSSKDITYQYTSAQRFYELAEAEVADDTLFGGGVVDGYDIEVRARELAKAEVLA